MFVPLESAAWPAPGEVRDLRVSLNAPVILGHGEAAEATRAALGWIPGAGPAAAVRLWMRPEGDPGRVQGFELRDRPLGPAARATALERAERFLAGLGFLFDAAPDSARPPGAPPFEPVSFGRPASASRRTSDPGPVPESAADRPATAAAVRADVRLTRLRSQALPGRVLRPPGPDVLPPPAPERLRRPAADPSPRGLLARLLRSWTPRSGGIDT